MNRTIQLLVEYYRCPTYLNGFAKSCREVLDDAFAGVGNNGIGAQLTFEVPEVIENLRRERYAAGFHGDGHILTEALRRAYYLFRPLLPVFVRKNMQRTHLRGWDKIRFPAWPVDKTVERIHQRLLRSALEAQGLKEIPFIWFWPNGHRSCAIMTHDIETLSGREFTSRLMDVDESFGIRSAFQIVPERRYRVPQRFRDSIRERGFETNIHDLNHDGHLFSDRAEFLRRAERINGYATEWGVRGFRSAALYRNTDWYDAFEFSYDMSVPNVAHLDPQRGGCCTVMPYFIGNILELPLTTTQDYTLFHILRDYSTELWKRQTALILEQHGLMSFVTHPDYLQSKRALATYIALLEHLVQLRDEENIWITLPAEVDAWWRQRSRMRLVYSHGEWQIEGDGSQQAQLAYASLDGESLVYHLPKLPKQHRANIFQPTNRVRASRP